MSCGLYIPFATCLTLDWFDYQPIGRNGRIFYTQHQITIYMYLDIDLIWEVGEKCANYAHFRSVVLYKGHHVRWLLFDNIFIYKPIWFISCIKIALYVFVWYLQQSGFYEGKPYEILLISYPSFLFIYRFVSFSYTNKHKVNICAEFHRLNSTCSCSILFSRGGQTNG